MSAPADALSEAQRAFAAGDAARARALAETVLAFEPHSLPALAVVANAANAQQDFAAAVRALERLRALQPANASLRAAHALALNNLGSLHYRDGRLEPAAAAYRDALAVDPDHVLALTNLGACAERQRAHADAADGYRRLAALQPGNVAAALGASRALRALGDEVAAADALAEAGRRAQTAADRVGVASEHLRIGAAADAGRVLGDASGCDDAGLAAIARMQADCNATAAARASFGLLAARTRARGDSRAAFVAERDAAVLLPQVSADAGALHAARADYAGAIAALTERWTPDRLLTAGVTLDDLARSHFLLAYQGGDDRALATRYGDWLAAAAAALDAPSPAVASPRIRRVGLVGARWTQGTIAAYFGSWIGALRAAGLEVVLFSSGNADDAVSAALAAQATHAERLPRPLATAAARVRAARLDLLIYPEVGLDAATEVLAALRLAPRQWAAWGHPVTTGLPTIDRFLSVAAMEPAAAAQDYREPLALLPGIGTRYARPARAGAGARAALGLPDGPLYALPHAPVKLHPDVDALLVAISRADRDARFVLIDDEVPALGRALRARLADAFAAARLDAGAHCITLPRLPIDAYRRLLAAVDVVIDTPHFSGGNTSLDALAQATPVVTMEGRFMRGRQTAAMLRQLDVPELVARDAAHAASVAIELAHSPDRRADIAQRIDANAAQLFDRGEPLQALVELLEP